MIACLPLFQRLTSSLCLAAWLPAVQVRGVGPDIDVQIPSDPRQRFVIDAMAFYVMRDGCEFEQVGLADCATGWNAGGQPAHQCKGRDPSRGFLHVAALPVERRAPAGLPSLMHPLSCPPSCTC